MKKKIILTLLALVLIALVGYSVYRAPRASAPGQASDEPRTYTDAEKADILKSLAGPQATSSIPSVSEQQKILKALAGDSQATSSKPNMASSSQSSSGPSEEEKKKILESLAK